MKQLLLLCTLIPLVSNACDQAAYEANKKKDTLTLGREIYSLQQKVEQSLFDSVVPEAEIDTAIAKKLPTELVTIIYDYHFPTIDDLHEAACKSVDLNKAKYLSVEYFSRPLQPANTHLYCNKQKMDAFITLGFRHSVREYLVCLHCNNALSPAIAWMLFPFHRVGAYSKPQCAIPPTTYGQVVPRETKTLQKYLRSHFYNAVNNQKKGSNWEDKWSALWCLLIFSNRFEMADRQALEELAAHNK